MAFHPLTKHVNRILNQYLRNFVIVDKQDWMDYVGLAEFSYNVATYLATKQSPFKVTYGMGPFQPTNLVFEGDIRHKCS